METVSSKNSDSPTTAPAEEDTEDTTTADQCQPSTENAPVEDCDTSLSLKPAVDATELSDNEDDSPPTPAEYISEDGSMLQFTFTAASSSSSKAKRCIYHNVVVRPDDKLALCMYVECDRSEKDCTLAICSDDVIVEGTFATFFTKGSVLKPIRAPGGIVRVCICPVHRQATMASPLMDAAKCAIALSPLPSGSGGWRAIAENGDSYVRFFSVDRTTSCYCDFPVLFSS